MATKKIKSDLSIEQGLSLPNKTASRALKIDATGNVVESTVTETQLEALPADVSAAQADATQALADAAAAQGDATQALADAATADGKAVAAQADATQALADAATAQAAADAAQVTADAAIPAAEKGAINGVATLDGGGKIPVAQLPNSVMEYKGTFDPATATFTDAGGNAGDVYLASADGSYNAGSGAISYLAGDWAVHNGTIFEKSLNSNAVVSVNGQTGTVVLDADDIDDAATVNKFVTSADVTKLGHISVTQAVDLDTMESDIALNNAARHDAVTLAAGVTQEAASLTGQQLTLNQATTVADGVMSSEDKTKLDGIEAGATADQSAAEVPYSNATSGLTATNAQAAIDEVEGRVDTLEASSHAAVTLNADDPTQQTLNLSGQEIQVNLATTITDGAMSAEDKSKLDGIEAGADVTDTANVDAAGATMNSDTSLVGNSYFLDEDDMVSNDATKVPSQQSVKAYVDSQIASGGNFSAGDIKETSASLADNQVAAADVTGLAFANATVRSFECQISIVRGATYEVYRLTGIQKGASWDMAQESVGDDCGITFSITAAGQVQYTSTSTGSGATVKFRADTTSV